MFSQKVALIHTSQVFIQRERTLFDLFDELLPGVEKVNLVDDGMLAEVMQADTISPQVARRMALYVLAAEAMGVDVIFNTCSSLGPAFDLARKLVTTPTLKIDEGMAERAVQEGRRIAVLATVPTTLGPTEALIQEKAGRLGKNVEVRQSLSQGAFELLMQQQTARHDEMVADTARQVAAWADILVLAQGSMARLAPRLAQETGRTVLSSPRLGVEKLKQMLAGLQAP